MTREAKSRERNASTIIGLCQFYPSFKLFILDYPRQVLTIATQWQTHYGNKTNAIEIDGPHAIKCSDHLSHMELSRLHSAFLRYNTYELSCENSTKTDRPRPSLPVGPRAALCKEFHVEIRIEISIHCKPSTGPDSNDRITFNFEPVLPVAVDGVYVHRVDTWTQLSWG